MLMYHRFAAGDANGEADQCSGKGTGYERRDILNDCQPVQVKAPSRDTTSHDAVCALPKGYGAKKTFARDTLPKTIILSC
jgi:hypothetical protein